MHFTNVVPFSVSKGFPYVELSISPRCSPCPGTSLLLLARRSLLCALSVGSEWRLSELRHLPPTPSRMPQVERSWPGMILLSSGENGWPLWSKIAGDVAITGVINDVPWGFMRNTLCSLCVLRLCAGVRRTHFQASFLLLLARRSLVLRLPFRSTGIPSEACT